MEDTIPTVQTCSEQFLLPRIMLFSPQILIGAIAIATMIGAINRLHCSLCSNSLRTGRMDINGSVFTRGTALSQSVAPCERAPKALLHQALVFVTATRHFSMSLLIWGKTVLLNCIELIAVTVADVWCERARTLHDARTSLHPTLYICFIRGD